MFAAFLLLIAGEPTAPVSTPPAAVAAPTAAPLKSAKADPMVCETSEEIGSRLRKKRQCMRRSEWRELRNSNQQQIDRAQTQMPINGGG